MIYTKTGDKGTTSLVGGTRVLKCDSRVEAYGTVDELNSHLGVIGEMMGELDTEYYNQIKEIQNRLFVIQTLLATEDDTLRQKMPQLPDNAVETVERWIDNIQNQLPKNQAFVIAGGSLLGAQCHVARCVCRRAERRIVELMQQIDVEEKLERYINRLSDYLFVLSRLMVIHSGKEENFWHA